MNKQVRLVLLIVLAGWIAFSCGEKPKPKVTPPPEVEKPEAEPQPPVEEPVVKPEEPEIALDLKTIYFDFDKSNIRPDQRERLIDNAEQLMAYPNVRVLIEGHCDERGTNEYNMSLGERRAKSARDFLISYGIEPTRLEIISYGEERPADPRHNEDAMAKNRSAEITVLEI